MITDPVKVYIADPGQSEMRLGLAGDVIPEFREVCPETLDKESKRAWKGTSSTANALPLKVSLTSDTMFNKHFTQFVSSKIKDPNVGLIVLEKNIQYTPLYKLFYYLI
jgi:hypothetical protein